MRSSRVQGMLVVVGRAGIAAIEVGGHAATAAVSLNRLLAFATIGREPGVTHLQGSCYCNMQTYQLVHALYTQARQMN